MIISKRLGYEPNCPFYCEKDFWEVENILELEILLTNWNTQPMFLVWNSCYEKAFFFLSQKNMAV